MRGYCFSPEEYDRPFNSESNVKCYVSCMGTLEGGICEGSQFKNILRFPPSHKGSLTPCQVIGKMIWSEYGGELSRFCHFGPEASILERLVERMLTFKVDLRSLLSNAPIYNTKKHIEKLGLQAELPGLCRHGGERPDTFFKLGVWKTGGGAVGSEGASVNMWSLLTAASLVGSNHIHCKNSSRIANNLMGLILESAPAAVTPGNLIPLRSFEEVSRGMEIVQIKCNSRPENYLRPVNDVNFAINGVYSYCRVEDGEMPEDFIGFGYVRSMSKFLRCKYVEVPPEHVMGHYQLMPDRWYCIYSHEKKQLGSMLISQDSLKVRFELDESASEILDCEFDQWEDTLRAESYLVLPTIFRSGALVTLEGDDDGVGCLVSKGARHVSSGGSFLSNYDHECFCYHALVGEGEGSYENISAESIFERLIAPGAVLWIKPGSNSWTSLSQFFPGSTLGDELNALRMVKVRLNVPLVKKPEKNKVYVTVLYKKLNGFQTVDIEIQHLPVDPWELSRNGPGSSALEIHSLMS